MTHSNRPSPQLIQQRSPPDRNQHLPELAWCGISVNTSQSKSLDPPPRGRDGPWRQANGKRAEVHTPPPNPSAWLPGGGSTARGNRRPRAGCLLPHGTGPTPNPSGAPAPTHPGAGVGGCRVGSWSNRRGSSAPLTSWLQKARSRPSYLPRSQPGPRARRPARARKLRPGAGGRGGAERPAARGSAQQPPLARLLLASEVSLAASLAWSVRASVRPWGPPSPAATAAAAAAAAAAPAPARQRVPSPPRCSDRGLAGSLARSLPPPLPAPRGAKPGRPRAASPEVPLPRGEAVGARRGRGGEERRVRGRRQGCALGSLPIPAGPAAPGPAGERRAARQRRERGGGPGVSPREGAQGEGVRGGVTPRAMVCMSVSACVCVCVCVCVERSARVSGGWGDEAEPGASPRRVEES
ncbi:uncharacterized protein LOC128928247 [Callithrix jacchus]